MTENKMEELFQKRKKKQQKQLYKYMRYVFNDHFTMVLFFVFGGMLYAYSMWIKQGNFFSPLVMKIGITVVLLASLYIGQIATFLKEADDHFLLPKEEKLTVYLKKAYFHSFVVPFLVLIFVVALLYPLLITQQNIKSMHLFFLVLTLFSLKSLVLLQEIASFYHIDYSKLFFFISSALFLFSALHSTTAPFSSLVLVGYTIYQCRCFQKRIKNHAFIWKEAIEKEQLRMKRLYHFISLFTDVPQMKTKVKRRRYVDFIYRYIPKEHAFTYTYLYAHRMIRGGEYSQLFFSLFSLSMTLMLVFQNQFVYVLGVVTLYLLGVQVIPLYNQFYGLSMAQLYPITKAQKQANFKQFVFYLLSVTAFLFSFPTIFFFSFFKSFLLFVLLLIEAYSFSTFYVSKRLKKDEKQVIL